MSERCCFGGWHVVISPMVAGLRGFGNEPALLLLDWRHVIGDVAACRYGGRDLARDLGRPSYIYTLGTY